MNRTVQLVRQTTKVIRTLNHARAMSSAGADGSHIGGQLNKKEKAEENRWVRQEEAKRAKERENKEQEGETVTEETVKRTKIQTPKVPDNSSCTIL